jgi:hypothetical protein
VNLPNLDGTQPGLPLRLYAAIHLRVPMSGLSWLDEMIREARLLDGMTDRPSLKHAMENLQKRTGVPLNHSADPEAPVAGLPNYLSDFERSENWPPRL